MKNMLRSRNLMCLRHITASRSYSTASNGGDRKDHVAEDLHPIRRTFRLLGNDMRKIKNFFVPQENEYDLDAKTIKKFAKTNRSQPSDEFQTHCDILVIGGGGVGSSIAYWLKEKARDGLNVVVVEQDETLSKSSSKVCTGSLSQQFSMVENIQMSLFGADFIRNAGQHFGHDIPLRYTPYGQLVLANESDAETLKKASLVQQELGARNELLSPERLSAKFPWLNTQGVALGCLGLEREGWFDSLALLINLRRAAKGYGAHFVHGEVTDFVFQQQDDVIIIGDDTEREGTASYQGLDKVVIKLPDGTHRTVKFAICVIAAGAQSGHVAGLAHIGNGAGILRLPVPIDARRRYLWEISAEELNKPGCSLPVIVDTSGAFVRRNGLSGNYICSQNVATHHAEQHNQDPESYFETMMRPTLSQRIPAFATAQLLHSSSGSLGYNVYDENGILGPHPYYNNLYIACGFSGQGMQQAPAVGRAISELIMDGQFRTVDLSRLSFDRLIVDKPMFEFNALN